MDQIEHNQAAMREEIDTIKSKVDQILETMLTRAKREDELHNAVTIGNVVPVQGSTPQLRPVVPNPLIYDLSPGYTSPLKGIPTQPVHIFVVTDRLTAQEQPATSHIPPPHINEELQNEYERQNYHEAIPVINPVVAQDSEAIQICRTLAQKLRVMEGHNSASMNALEMSLVSDVVIPAKFKVSDFEKYKSRSCPKIHLKMYCRKMAQVLAQVPQNPYQQRNQQRRNQQQRLNQQRAYYQYNNVDIDPIPSYYLT